MPRQESSMYRNRSFILKDERNEHLPVRREYEISSECRLESGRRVFLLYYRKGKDEIVMVLHTKKDSREGEYLFWVKEKLHKDHDQLIAFARRLGILPRRLYELIIGED